MIQIYDKLQICSCKVVTQQKVQCNITTEEFRFHYSIFLH